MKRKKLRKNIKNAFLLLLMAVLASLVGFYLQRKENFVNEYIDVTYETVNTEEIYTASMVMVGDALMHMPINRTYKTSNGYDFKGIFKYIKPIVEEYDLAYYNQETMLGGSSLGLSGYPQFNSPTEVGEAFVDAGFNLVSLATNHTLDGRYRYSNKAITNSRNFWNKQEGVIAAGSYTSQEERDKVIIKEVNGRKIDIKKSYQKMKSLGIFNENLLVYENVLPKVSYLNKYDKVIIPRYPINNISLVFEISDEGTFYNTNKILVDNGIEASIIFENVNNDFDINKSNFKNILSTTYNNGIDYCISFNTTVNNDCKNNKKYTLLVKENIISNNFLNNTKKAINNHNNIIIYRFNSNNLSNLNTIIKYLKSNNYNITSALK